MNDIKNACNYQCTIPAFEGLVDNKSNNEILDLLYDLVVWHAFAKMCMHTEFSLWLFKSHMQTLGKTLCQFKNNTCKAYQMTELLKEEAVCICCNIAVIVKEKNLKLSTIPSEKAKTEPKITNFNLVTYKLHSLGDVSWYICFIDTTDNYTSQIISVSLFFNYSIANPC